MPLLARSVQTPLHIDVRRGAVSDLGGGLFQYSPNARATEGFVDHFAVIADDGHGGVVTKTVALKV